MPVMKMRFGAWLREGAPLLAIFFFGFQLPPVLVLGDPRNMPVHGITHMVTTTDKMEKAEKIAKMMGETGLVGGVINKEHVDSVYEWKGHLERDEEIRLEFPVQDPEKAMAELEKHHDYGVPMIIWPHDKHTDAKYWRLTTRVQSLELAHTIADEVVTARHAACVQILRHGKGKTGLKDEDGDEVEEDEYGKYELTMKTTSEWKDGLEEYLQHTVGGGDKNFHWDAIDGNEPYMKWMEETVAPGRDAFKVRESYRDHIEKKVDGKKPDVKVGQKGHEHITKIRKKVPGLEAVPKDADAPKGRFEL